MEKKIFTFKIKINEMYYYQTDLDYADDSLPKLQDRTRRNNIQVDEATEEKGETCQDCEKKVLGILRNKLET